MAVWASTDFTGGAIGTAPSAATEPVFDAAGGSSANASYQALVGPGSGQSVQTSGAFHYQLNLDGRTHVRVGFDVQRVSGTQTAGQITILWRQGTTLRGDAFFRNQNGGQWALRGTTAAPTAYLGQSARTQANGETYHVEMEWEAGVGTALHLWHPGSTPGDPPDESFTSDMTNPVDQVLILNATGSTGLTFRYSSFRATDGEPIWDTPALGTVNWAHNGYTRQGEFAVNVKTTDATTCAIEVDTDPGFSDPILVEADDKGDGYWSATATGLPADTLHYWRALADGAPSAVVGQCKTLPATGALRLGWGSCFDSNNSGVFGLIADRQPDAFIMLGDYGYAYITGGPNGNTSPTDVATVRAHREPVLTATGPRALFAAIGYDYTYSDCDGAGANADGTTGGHATGAVQQAYRQQFAHPDLPLVNSGGRSWTWGRVRFILTDETAAASVRDSTDNSSKSKLGAEQKAWFKDQIDTAATNGEAVIWFGDGPWIEPTGAGSATYNSWARYNTERTELGQYIANSAVPLIRLHGDTHTLFLDDGSNNPWGGFPTASAAPMHTTGQAFGYTTSGSKWPTTTTNSSRQYGICDIADDGTTLTVALAGYSSTVSAPTEVQRFSQTFTLLEQPATTGTLVASTPAATVMAAASISGTATVPVSTGSMVAAVPTITIGRTVAWGGTSTKPTSTGAVASTAPAATVGPAVATIAGETVVPVSTGSLSSSTPALTAAVPLAALTGATAGASQATLISMLPTVTVGQPGATIAGTTTAPAAYGGTLVAVVPLIAIAPVVATIAGASSSTGQRDITITLGPPITRRLEIHHPTGRPFAIGTPRS